MHVVVVGCGRVGSGLAQALEVRGHTVGIIDRRSRQFALLHEGFAGKTVAGVGFDRDRLRDAGIGEAGAVAAVTSGDNSNILVARIAREAYGIERVVARIKDPRRAAIYERLGVPTIATRQWTIERILRRALPDAPAVEWTDPSTRVALIERYVPPAWAGRRVTDLDIADRARVVAVSRLGVSRIANPKSLLQEGDLAFVAVDGELVDEFDTHMAGGDQQ